MEIIENFCNTFNIKEYKKLNSENKKFFYEASKIVLQQKNGNISLAQIVTNYYKKQMKPVKYLRDSIYFEMLKKDDMNVLLIGDRHSDVLDVNCGNDFSNSISVPMFLQNLVTTEPFFFDIFSETAFYSDILFPVRGSFLIQSVNEEFKNCFVPAFRKNSINYNMRCHLTDFRKDFSKTKVKNLMKNLSNKNVFKKFLTMNENDSVESLKNFLNTKISFKDYKEVQYLLIQESNKIKKQIKDENISKEIIDISWEVYIKSEFLKLKEWCDENPIQKNRKNYKKHSNFIRNTLITATLLDYYTLGRIFRNFQRKSYSPQMVSNSIVVAGNKHIELYKKIFKNRGFTSVYLSIDENDKKKCLNIENFNYRKLALKN